MDALRKSVQGTDTEGTHAASKKKPPTRAATLFPDHEKAGPTLVTSAAKGTKAAKAKGSKRKSA
jgi:hypothetical protein